MKFINKTRFILASAQADSTVDSWARRAVKNGGAGLKGDRNLAYKAVVSKNRLFPARDENEAVAWMHRAYDALRAQKAICAVSAECQKSPEQCGHLAARAGLPIAHDMNQWAFRVGKTSEILGLIRRYTRHKGEFSVKIAEWIAEYLTHNPGCRNWLHPRRIEDLFLIAKVWRKFDVTHFPASVLLKVAKMDRPWFLADLMGRSHEFTDNFKIVTSKFWRVVAKLLKEGGTGKLAGLQTASSGKQVHHLVPGGYDQEIHQVLKAHSRSRLFAVTGAYWGHDPQEQQRESRYRFALLRGIKWGAYRDLASEGVSPEMALRIVCVFGSEARQWIKKTAPQGGENAIHDIAFFLPIGDKEEVKGLAKWLFGHHQRMGNYSDRNVIKAVCQSWSRLREEDRNLPWEDLYAATQVTGYGVVPSEAIDFARECAKWSLPQYAFGESVERYLHGLETPHVFESLVGKTWHSVDGELRGYFLDRQDPRGAWLGQYTDCCQHLLHPMGGQCARFGMSSKDSGFFVFENQREIQAQAWIWRTEEGTCFDNIEALRTDAKMKKNILQILRSVAASILEVSAPGSRVTLGTGLDSEGFYSEFSDLDADLFLNPEDIGYPAGGYRDSNTQVLVAE